MIFMCTYQVDRDKQAETQAFFANMTEEQRAGEVPDGVNLIGRWHDLPNGWWVSNSCGRIARSNHQLDDVLVRRLYIPSHNPGRR